MKLELPVVVPVRRILDEANGIKSIFLPCTLGAKPGQFVMVWLPGVDAKPASVSYQDENSFGITIAAVGLWSKRICAMKEGGLLGVMGPYGNNFSLEGRNVIIAGGGYGTASLMLLAEQAVKEGKNITAIIGAKSAAHILYRERMQRLGIKTIFTTDDGSFGEKGFVTDSLERILKENKTDKVFGCGPELMEKRVAELCARHGVACELSLERRMKCGFGVCGSCCIDDTGKRVCAEGTVFSGEELLRTKEFGKYRRNGSAEKQAF